MGNMKANRKFKDGEEAVSAVIGVILMVAITVAIAATVYVYVTGMIGGGTTEKENASVTVSATDDDRIKILLAAGGQRYSDGYEITDAGIHIFVNEDEVSGFTAVTWNVGEPLYIGSDTGTTTFNFVADGTTGIAGGDYSVTVTILESVIFDGEVHII